MYLLIFSKRNAKNISVNNKMGYFNRWSEGDEVERKWEEGMCL